MNPETLALHGLPADAVRDLQRTPRQLQARYLYDALGSALFDAICLLPWYAITRAERQLLTQHGEEIAASLSAADGAAVVELGCGNGEKLEVLVEAFRGSPVEAHLIDISPRALAATSARLAALRHVRTVEHTGTYQDGLDAVAGQLDPAAPTLVLFLGSNIGNFDPEEAAAFLRGVRAAVPAGAFFLLGADLVKPEADLLLAYDDPLGVTAAFNRNLLRQVNEALAADFDLTAFDHRAVWNADRSRVEMHLVSPRPQRVHLRAAGVILDFAAGESIWTESSYKYTAEGIQRLTAAGGFAPVRQWIDDHAGFALTLFRAV